MKSLPKRLRGDAPEVVWPRSRRFAEALSWRRELRRMTPEHTGPEAPAEEREMSERTHEDWWEAMGAWRSAAVDAFARANGWTRAKHELHPTRLLPPKLRKPADARRPWWHDDRVFEHPDFLLQGRRIAGVVVHLYSPVALDRLPESIVVDELPSSWYWPGRTRAYLLRPAGLPAAVAT